jgi:hypothetical protein
VTDLSLYSSVWSATRTVGSVVAVVGIAVEFVAAVDKVVVRVGAVVGSVVRISVDHNWTVVPVMKFLEALLTVD